MQQYDTIMIRPSGKMGGEEAERNGKKKEKKRNWKLTGKERTRTWGEDYFTSSRECYWINVTKQMTSGANTTTKCTKDTWQRKFHCVSCTARCFTRKSKLTGQSTSHHSLPGTSMTNRTSGYTRKKSRHLVCIRFARFVYAHIPIGKTPDKMRAGWRCPHSRMSNVKMCG